MYFKLVKHTQKFNGGFDDKETVEIAKFDCGVAAKKAARLLNQICELSMEDSDNSFTNRSGGKIITNSRLEWCDIVVVK